MKVYYAKDRARVKKTDEREKIFYQFKEIMSRKNSRWAVYDLKWNTNDGRKLNNLLFLFYLHPMKIMTRLKDSLKPTTRIRLSLK